MSPHERETIKDLKKCNFSEINVHFKLKSEERKAMSKEEKNVKSQSIFLRTRMEGNKIQNL